MVFKRNSLTAYMLILLAFGLLAVAAGCGKKGPPKPPVENTQPVK